MAVEVRLTPDRFVVTNPGRLYGITVDRLGRDGITSARNARLIEICRYARACDGARVVETLATGIPRIIASLTTAGLPPATFSDTGLRFTAILRRTAAPAATALNRLNDSERKVYTALADGDRDVSGLATATLLNAPNIRKVLRHLTDLGLVSHTGGRGQRTTYHRTRNPSPTRP